MSPRPLPLYRCGTSEGVEKVEGYRMGGFCPIRIGQILDNQYEIIAKLGYGGYSTVWLAKDISQSRCNSWVALKILKSDKSTKDNTELAILQSFQQSSIVNCFGPSVAQYVESLWYGVLDSHTAIDLSRQCVVALKTLHDLGYTHGDVCSANFVLGLSDISGFTKESMRRYLGDSWSGVVSSRDSSALPPGIPERLFQSVSFEDLVDPSRVMIIDLGEAFSGWKEGVATHLPYRAPELLVELGATVKSDIWSMGCLIYELVTSQTPFSRTSTTIDKEQALYFAKSLDEQYKYLRGLLLDHSVLGYEEENDMLASLLCEMLVQDPQKRVDLGQLLEHDFFKFAGCPPELE
ncbi:kinase-like domain-containing protein [Amylocarpus encephaloides]|uniref:Kinase-like domain-containing protein n=1 Tax=Amylocarpus encephaloides TaxID=45428 RepID=A0A9P8C5V2_9HELO|nr:kinase-like domain-containing protein [Amylocarpus encephaloides]